MNTWQSYRVGLMLAAAMALMLFVEPAHAERADPRHQRAKHGSPEEFIGAILSVPLLPLRLVDALSDTGTGIREVAATGDRIAEVAEKLPTHVRVEVERMEPSLARAERIGSTIERTTDNVARAGDSWAQMFQSLDALIETVQTRREEAAKAAATRDGPDDGFDLKEVTRAVEALATTAHELRRTAEEVHAILKSDVLASHLQSMNGTTKQAIDHTAFHAMSLTDHFTGKLSELVVVIVLGVALCRILAAHKAAVEAQGRDRRRRRR